MACSGGSARPSVYALASRASPVGHAPRSLEAMCPILGWVVQFALATPRLPTAEGVAEVGRACNGQADILAVSTTDARAHNREAAIVQPEHDVVDHCDRKPRVSVNRDHGRSNGALRERQDVGGQVVLECERILVLAPAIGRDGGGTPVLGHAPQGDRTWSRPV